MAKDHRARFLVAPGARVSLRDIDPRSTAGAPDKKDDKARLASADLVDRLAQLQDRLWAENARSLLVVFQAVDAGGKDSTIRRVFSGVNPQGCRVASFKQPTELELEHDFLWRIHRDTPKAGEIAIFNRSHYEDVLVVRVKELVPPEVWSSRYRIINDFEHALTDAGTTIVKFLLHISAEEQAERLRDRIDDPAKHWKFRAADLDERKRWDAYQAAFEDALSKTSTERAPWYVIPADRKWYRDWAVLGVLVDTLEELDPQYPDPDEDLSSIVID